MSNQNKIVLERILARKNSKNKNDGYKIGLILEGGGMRGVFSSGVACGLERLGLRDCFDVLYGSSAGSCNCAYLLTGQIELGTSIYYEDLTEYRFIKPWKIFKMMDLDYLAGIFRKGDKELDTKKLRESETILKAFVTDIETGKPHCFTNKDSVDMVNLIKASGSAPGFYNLPIKLGNVMAVDGNCAKKLPVEEAIADGCTDILIVPTVPFHYRESKFLIINFIKWLLMARLPKKFKKAYKKRREIYNSNLDLAFGVEPLANINVYTIFPDFLVSEAENKTNVVKKAAEHGADKVIKAFKGVGANEKVNN